MDHHRSMQFSVSSLVGRIEALREVVIHLDGSQLPFATDDVFDHEVNFRTVESRFTFFLRPRHTEGFCRRLHASSALSHRLGSPTYFEESGSRSPRNPVVFHAEFVEDDLHEFNAPEDFVGELVFETNRWASSWVNPRTRVNPEISPDCSQRYTVPNSARRRGRLRYERAWLA